MKFASRFLIALGVIIILIAFNMKVSVRGADVINFNMVAERQNFLLVGCVMFIAGIILYAATNQNKTRNFQNAVENNEENGELKLLLTKYGMVATKVSKIWKHIIGHFSRPDDSRIVRTLTGLFVGACLALPVLDSAADIESSSMWLAFIVFACMWLAFRPIPASQAIRPLLATNAILYLIPMIFIIYRALHPYDIQIDGEWKFHLAMILICMIPSAIYFGALFIVKPQQHNDSSR
jgi:hypothetical protein